MTKLNLLFVVILVCAGVAAAQPSAIETSFEKNKAKYTREHFVSGEDASSGFDYLFYKRADKIVMIRSIWSASHSKELRVQDIYFDGDQVALVRRSTAHERYLSTLKRGRNVVLKPKEELHFSDSKLTRWIEAGKTIANTDPRWAETEKSNLEHAKGELESYSWLKEGN